MRNEQKYIVDTNVFLRFLTNDIESQAKRVENRLLQAEKGNIKLRVLQITIVEILFHLERWYELSKSHAVEKIKELFIHEWMDVEDKAIVFLALDEYAKVSIDFVDLVTFNHAKMTQSHVLSFDKDYDSIVPSLRVEP